MRKNTLIRHTNKQTNVTYLYWGHLIYIPGKDYPEVKKKGIGKIGSKGEFEPKKVFLSFTAEEQMETGLVVEPFFSQYTRGDVDAYDSKMFGFIALLETAARESGFGPL